MRRLVAAQRARFQFVALGLTHLMPLAHTGECLMHYAAANDDAETRQGPSDRTPSFFGVHRALNLTFTS